MADSPVPDGFLPLPRVAAAELTYERFLTDFALPRKPFILEGVGAEWPAATRWAGGPDAAMSYLLAHEGVNLAHAVTATVRGLAGGSGVEDETTVGGALTKLRSRQPSQQPQDRYYLSAWDYVRGGSEALQRDFDVPAHFDRAPRWLAEHAVLGCAATDMRWLYIGEAGTGSQTHVDTNLSSAWLWVAQGRKEWVCAHGGDHALVSAPEGAVETPAGPPCSEAGAPLPDLFAPDLFERHPRLRRARLFFGVQRPGDVCFNPSGCVHAVRNTEFTFSLTHNFVDATNLADAARDAVVQIGAELLPMVRSLGPKRVVRTLAESLGVPKGALRRTLRDLPHLLADEAVADVVRAASAPRGAETEAEALAVERLLAAHLAGALDAPLRESFGAATRELVEALGLGAE